MVIHSYTFIKVSGKPQQPDMQKNRISKNEKKWLKHKLENKGATSQ